MPRSWEELHSCELSDFSLLGTTQIIKISWYVFFFFLLILAQTQVDQYKSVKPLPCYATQILIWEKNPPLHMLC